jgi:uncharacterized membrane protein
MGHCCSVRAVTGAFSRRGAGPVFGFGLTDAVYITSVPTIVRPAREEVSVSRTSLDIRKTAPSGKSEAHRFNPFWTRFSIARHAEIGITRMVVEAQGRTVSIGTFPTPTTAALPRISRALATAKAR